MHDNLGVYVKVGSLVRRKKGEFLGCGGYGIVVSLYRAGNPSHNCADVFWANDGSIYGIGCSRIETV